MLSLEHLGVAIYEPFAYHEEKALEELFYERVSSLEALLIQCHESTQTTPSTKEVGNQKQSDTNKKNIDSLETYQCVAMSTAQLNDSDLSFFKNTDSNMVMERDTGFFIKLYDELEYNLPLGLSDEWKSIATWAHENGFRLIEFDQDAELIDTPVFENI